MNRRYMGETRNVGLARQSAEEKNEIIDCFDGMGFIGQTKFSLEQMAELEDRLGIVGVAKQSEEEKNELVDCADGMYAIGQTRFSLEQMAELDERFQVPEIEISVVEIPDELENTIEEEYVWVFHDDVH